MQDCNILQLLPKQTNAFNYFQTFRETCWDRWMHFVGRRIRPGCRLGQIQLGKRTAYWAFQQPRSISTPSVKRKDWPAQPLDFFILSRLEQQHLSPSEQAASRALVRRVTFDITGLPPTREEVDSFVQDKRPDAYRRMVERLLDSPQFGERMASLWLPLARYAEDQAHQVGDDTKFFYPNAFKYREWVINAFNRDLPYDRFLKLQLAADKLEPDCKEDLAALGFLGLGPKYYDRGRIDVMADEWEDRVDTVCRTMLGLTVACARCHDHKFDPITTADYYSLAGVFASTKMVNRKPDGSRNRRRPPPRKWIQRHCISWRTAKLKI